MAERSRCRHVFVVGLWTPTIPQWWKIRLHVDTMAVAASMWPAVCRHPAAWKWQYMPVFSAPVHALFPQMQGAALLGADPSVFVQAGAVRVHMHVSL